jgi:hypothetical protein
VKVGRGVAVGNEIGADRGVRVGIGVAVGNGVWVGTGVTVDNGVWVGRGVAVGNGIWIGSGVAVDKTRVIRVGVEVRGGKIFSRQRRRTGVAGGPVKPSTHPETRLKMGFVVGVALGRHGWGRRGDAALVSPGAASGLTGNWPTGSAPRVGKTARARA